MFRNEFQRNSHSHSNQLPKVVIPSQETAGNVNAIVCTNEVNKGVEPVIRVI